MHRGHLADDPAARVYAPTVFSLDLWNAIRPPSVYTNQIARLTTPSYVPPKEKAVDAYRCVWASPPCVAARPPPLFAADKDHRSQETKKCPPCSISR